MGREGRLLARFDDHDYNDDHDNDHDYNDDHDCHDNGQAAQLSAARTN